jgi:N-formylglutamate deformylase
LNLTGRGLEDTDWHVDKLYSFAADEGATLIVATHARTVVDLNRSPAGGLLYPGQNETTICPTETFDGAPLYATAPPTPAEIANRVETYWRPYHNALAHQLTRLKTLHGGVHLLDAHSIRSTVPRLFPGVLPDLNFGTNSGAAARPGLAARALAATANAGFTQILDGRFRGGYITRHYGNPADGVQAIQLELARNTYLDEANPTRFDPARAARLIAILRLLVRELLRA